MAIDHQKHLEPLGYPKIYDLDSFFRGFWYILVDTKDVIKAEIGLYRAIDPEVNYPGNL